MCIAVQVYWSSCASRLQRKGRKTDLKMSLNTENKGNEFTPKVRECTAAPAGDSLRLCSET